MDTIYVEVCASVNGSLYYCDVEIGNEDDMKERIMEAYNDTNENEEDVEIDAVGDFEVVDWMELAGYESLQVYLDELSEYNGDLELDVLDAAAYLGISFDYVDEAYQGEYKSDEDFAEELMMDYSEHNGHYFRDL